MLQRYLITLQAENVRRETFDGREHLVAPAVAVISGVLNGELLPPDEIQASIEAWEGVPITLGHPMRDGQHVSANKREILQSLDVTGNFFGATFEENKLRGEIWIDVERAGKTEDGKTAVKKIEAGEMIEVSTGYWRTPEVKHGVRNGKSFNAIQRNIIPDHLAILLHEPGACSVEDGCGTPRTNRKEGSVPHEQDLTVQQFEHGIAHSELRKRLVDQIVSFERADAEIYVEEVFNDAVVYCLYLGNDQTTYLRQYTVGSQPDFDVEVGEPQEVQRVIGYEPVTNSEDSNQEEENMPKTTKEQKIAALAANEKVPFNEEQLKAMDDASIDFLANAAEVEATAAPVEGAPGDAAAEPTGEAEEEEEEATAGAQAAAEPVAAINRAKKGKQPVRVATNVAVLKPEVAAKLNELTPEAIDQVINSAAEISTQRKARKDELVSTLSANARCAVPKEVLQRMELEALEGLQKSINPASYAGRGHAVNVGGDDEIPAPPPVLLAKNEKKD